MNTSKLAMLVLVIVATASVVVLVNRPGRNEPLNDLTATHAGPIPEAGEASSQVLTPSSELSERTSTAGDAIQGDGPSVDGSSSSGDAPAPAPKSESDTWLAEYGTLTWQELADLRLSVEENIKAASDDYFDATFAAGLYEVVGHGNTWKMEGWERAKIMRVVVPSVDDKDQGEIRKAVLPEGQFPEVYRDKRLTLWMEARSESLRRAEYLANHHG